MKKDEPFKIPVIICRVKDIYLERVMTVKIVVVKDLDMVVCSGELLGVEECE